MSIRRTIAHLSDLHLGKSPHYAEVAAALSATAAALSVDCVVVTGDVTENGLQTELDEFYRLFQAWRDQGRLVVVPGNHDCIGGGIAHELMPGPRVDVVRTAGLSVIRVNTTGWHNRFRLASHGAVDRASIAEVDHLVDQVPPGDLVAVAMHHHPLPLPVDYFAEHLANWLQLPFAAELSMGKTLLRHLQGRCDLVLHGHRHMPWDFLWPGPTRTLHVYNAGCSTELKSFRLFTHQDGALVGEPVWVKADGGSAQSVG